MLQRFEKLTVYLCATALVVCATVPAYAGQGDCGQPSSDGGKPTTTDCLIMLRVGVGIGQCVVCVCDVNSTGTVTASDALLCLKSAVGQDVELDCPCSQSTTTTTTTTTSTTTIVSTTTTTVLNHGCPQLASIAFLANARGQCATNDDCALGACNTELARCITLTELDLGSSGLMHDADLNDSSRLLVKLECDGSAPVCGDCVIAGLDPGSRNCRCADDNRQVCNDPFEPNAGCDVGVPCECYLGSPLPLMGGLTPLCLINRMTADVTGTLDPDNGDLAVRLELRSLVYSGESPVGPCPSCGGRCLAPESKLDLPCTANADCDTESEQGECGRFDTVAGDGEREGLCVGGPSAGFGCDVQAINTTFPPPGGSGYSLDCFPVSGKNIGGQGLRVLLDMTTAPQTLGSDVPCGFPPSAPLQCPCGMCDGDPTTSCRSNTDCTAPAACEANGSVPNTCGNGTCAEDDTAEGSCAGGPADLFCDGVLRANGRGLLACNTNADCAGVAGGSSTCSIEEQRECFPSLITAAGQADPAQPVAVALSCISPSSNNTVNETFGLPGAGRWVSQLSAETFCDTAQTSAYAPGDGCH